MGIMDILKFIKKPAPEAEDEFYNSLILEDLGVGSTEPPPQDIPYRYFNGDKEHDLEDAGLGI